MIIIVGFGIERAVRYDRAMAAEVPPDEGGS
jgi:hypothetical protein